MRGQLGLEFMLISLCTLLLISAILSGLLAQRDAIMLRGAELLDVSAAEGAARAVEAGLHGPGRLPSGPVGLRYRIEGGSLHAPSGGGIIEIRGVFIADRDEPA